MKIPAEPSEAESRLLQAAIDVLTHMGAEVEIRAGGDNLVRCRPGGARPLVCAEGLPNLLHELVHVVQVGRLDDDHGIDYGQIPFDLETADGRRILWEELACCVLSCAYTAAPRPGEGAEVAARRVEAWFREQVEIQPVFYGMDGDVQGFWRRVVALLETHGHEQRAVLDEAYTRTHAVLAAHAAPEAARPPCRWTLEALLGRTGT